MHGIYFLCSLDKYMCFRYRVCLTIAPEFPSVLINADMVVSESIIPVKRMNLSLRISDSVLFSETIHAASSYN